jgi:dihydrofolate synthase/folylpolyglutamate synthase
MMNYDEALAFLRDLTKFGYNFGLGRITQLLKMLGNPQDQLKVIHIGGTNGKGSTAAMVTSVLKSAGYRVGFFSSPHIHNYTERMKINGEEIPRERIAALLTEIRPILEEMVRQGFEHPTEFEVNTALALLYFAREEVDLVVLEVGLGGAIDSTNVVEPLVAVITNVGMDHMDYLGNSLEEIARVKAGIIKERCKVVTAADKPEVIKIIEEVCQAKQAGLLRVGKDVSIELLSSTKSGVTFNLQGPGISYERLHTPLLGEHQALNAGVAVTTIKALASYGIEIPDDAVYQGLEQACWPARLEIMGNNPTVLIDAAHNVDGAKTLRKALDSLFSYRKLILVLGMLADKEREKVLELLAPLAEVVIVTRPNSPRAAGWEEIGELAAKYVSRVEVIASVEEAVNRGLLLADTEDLVCITGSIYMIAEARELILAKDSNKC